MRRVLIGFASFLVLPLACAGEMRPLLEGQGAAYGPAGNAEDMFRLIWGNGFGDQPGIPPFYDELLDCGFNAHLFYVWARNNYDFVKDAEIPQTEAKQVAFRKFLDRCLADNVIAIPQMGFLHDKALVKIGPRVRKDGVQTDKNPDMANPAVLGRVMRAARVVVDRCRHPAIRGFENASEIRDAAHPSFDSAMRAAYRAHSGHDVPEAVTASLKDITGRQPPHWKTLEDFPVDRVVDDDYPVLDFYVWMWMEGDGWLNCLNGIVDVVKEGAGRDVFTMYDPSLRTPPLWGSGGDVTFLNYWSYPYPEPYNVSYSISEQQSRARKTKQGVMAMIQAIGYRSRLAPIGEHPSDEPAWSREYPNAKYPTTPPDLMREAIWSVFTRKVDGIALHGLAALWDHYERMKTARFSHGGTGYVCSNPETRDVIRETLQDVGIPLGPLFRCIPERPSKVAIVESYASVILGARISWDCLGKFVDYGIAATAANLMPMTIMEAEIRDCGIPDSVETLIMPQCDVLTRKCFEKIRAFKGRGGRIVADRELCPALQADAYLPFICAAAPKGKSDHDEGTGDACRGDVRERDIKRAAVALKTLVGRKAAPYADSENADLLVSVRSYGLVDYVFVVNDRRTYGDYVGAWKRIREKGLPNAGTVVVKRKAGAVYDLVRHSSVPFAAVGDETHIDVRFNTTDGKVFMLTEEPLRELRAKVRGSKIVVKSEDVDPLIPIRIVGFTKSPFYAIVRGGVYEHDFGAFPHGAVQVKNLATGEECSCVTVGGMMYD